MDDGSDVLFDFFADEIVDATCEEVEDVFAELAQEVDHVDFNVERAEVDGDVGVAIEGDLAVLFSELEGEFGRVLFTRH